MSDEIELKSGLEIDNYRFDCKLGAGGMGEVWLADDLNSGKQVAVKVLSSPGKQQRIKRFRQEVQILTKLHHPNIVRVLGSGQFHDIHYMVMNYVEGYDLGYFMHKCEFDEKDVLEIGLEVCKAMEYAWEEHGILHRDIKPGNVMVDREMNVFLMDLGISKSNQSEEIMNLTQAGVLVGTPKYMSPEQARGDELDFRADIYSTGATMYRLITAKAPFEGETLVELLTKLATSPLTPARQHNQSISLEFEQLLNIMLSKEADDRHKSWGSLIDDIDRVLNGSAPQQFSKTPNNERQEHKAELDKLKEHMQTIAEEDYQLKNKRKLPYLKPAKKPNVDSFQDKESQSVVDDISRLKRLKESFDEDSVDDDEKTEVNLHSRDTKPKYKLTFEDPPDSFLVQCQTFIQKNALIIIALTVFIVTLTAAIVIFLILI